MKASLLMAERVRTSIAVTFATAAAGGCGQRALIVPDAFTQAGQPLVLEAYFEDHWSLLTRAIPGVPVRFSMGGRVVGTSKSDQSGRAILRCSAENAASTFTAKVTHGEAEWQGQGRIFVWDAQDAVIVVDVDETISRTRYLQLVVNAHDRSLPLPGCQPALCQLSDSYQLIYISARPRILLDKTRRWLDQHGFPEAPVRLSSDLNDVLHQAAFKCALIDDLRRQWTNLRIGIGDQPADVHAFRRNEVLPVIVNSAPWFRPEGTVVCQNWKDVGSYFQKAARVAGSSTPSAR